MNTLKERNFVIDFWAKNVIRAARISTLFIKVGEQIKL